MHKTSIRSLLAQPNFRNLYLAGVASEFGSIIGLISFTLFLLDRFSSQPFYATLTEMMYSLPMLSIFFLVGVVADRMDRQRIAKSCDWLRALLTLLLLLSIHQEIMPLTFLILFIRTAIGCFFVPAQAGLSQGVVTREERLTASGINQTTSSLFLLVGNGIGVLFYKTVGVEGALLVDALSFAVSAWFIGRCHVDDSVRLPNGTTKWKDLNLSLIWRDLKDGSRYILQHRLLFALMKGLVFIGILNGGLSVLPLYLMKYKLAPDTYEAMSVTISVAVGCGVLAGSSATTFLLQKFRPYQLIILSCLASGVLLTLEGFTTEKWIFVGLHALNAFCTPFLTISFFGWRAQIVDRKMMGRVRAWHSPIVQLSHSIMLAFIAWAFPNHLGIEWLFCVLGVAFLSLGGYYLWVLPSLARRVEQEASLSA